MKKVIAVLPGDGIGAEITAVSVAVLQKIAGLFGHDFSFREGVIGATAIDQTGDPYPEATSQLCKQSDAVLFGAIGDPKYDNDPSAPIRPEQGLLAIRKDLELYANVRPISTFKSTSVQSPLRPDIVKDVDFVVVRELIGGIYFGKHERTAHGAIDICEYTEEEITRILKYAFKVAQSRRKKLTVVDKANVLETSRLWREMAQKMSREHPDITVEFMFVDNAAMQIIQRPAAFDVIVTENMFGDILTDEASVITGSLGMLPSASVGGKVSMFEPIHGSYPQAAGKNIANPLGSVLSAAMLLEYSFGLTKESQTIVKAVEVVLEQGFGTEDLSPKTKLSTTDLGKKLIASLEK